MANKTSGTATTTTHEHHGTCAGFKVATKALLLLKGQRAQWTLEILTDASIRAVEDGMCCAKLGLSRQHTLAPHRQTNDVSALRRTLGGRKNSTSAQVDEVMLAAPPYGFLERIIELLMSLSSQGQFGRVV